MTNILITGGTGLLGTKLTEHFVKMGQNITVLSRYPDKYRDLEHDKLKYIEDLSEAPFKYDTIINLAGSPLSVRWGERSKEEIYNSRIETTKNLVVQIAKAEHKPKLLISGSAIGIYGHSDSYQFTEEVEPSNPYLFSMQLCKDWEDEAYNASTHGVRVCTIRTGMVLSKEGGALAKMLPYFKLFLGNTIGHGQQYMSWIHIEDWVRIVQFCIDRDSIYGPINATAPKPVTNEEFATAIGDALYRPILLRIPAFLMRFLFGKMADELLLKGAYVVPDKLRKNGFKFRHPEIHDAISECLKKAT